MSDPRTLKYQPGRIVVIRLDQGKSRPWLIMRRFTMRGEVALLLNGLTSKPGYLDDAIPVPVRFNPGGGRDAYLAAMYRVVLVGGANYGLPYLTSETPVSADILDAALQRYITFAGRGEHNHE